MAASDIGGDVRVDELNAQPGSEPEDEEGFGTMTLVEHLEELRGRLFKCIIAIAIFSVLGFIFWEQMLHFLSSPLPNVSGRLLDGKKFLQKDVGEAFVIALKLAVAAGITLASPVIIYQLWQFIAPGLTRRERKYALPFTALGSVLFVTGLTVGFVTLRYPIAWLIGFGNQDFALALDPNSYFTFVAYFLLAFGIVFELPMVLTFLATAGIVSSRLLREKRKYILFGLWVLSCFITPGADPYSPVIVAVSFTVLFELSVLLMRIIGK